MAGMRTEQKASTISRFPTEILQLIFDDVVNAVVSNDAYLNYDAPRTGRDIMLQEAVYSRGQDLDRIISVGNASPWSLILRTRKRLVLVCWAWWATGISSIYECVYIHRIGQLPALVRTLEESAAVNDDTGAAVKRSEWEATHGGEEGYGRWIKHITMVFHLPYSWLDVYCSGVDRLLDRCSHLLSFVHLPLHSPPLFKEPLSETFMESLWNGSIGADFCNDRHRQRQSLSSPKHLSIGPRNLVLDSIGGRFLETFKHLTSLELLLSRHDKHFERLEDKSDVVPLTFPCLRCLAINIRHKGWYRAQLSCILKRWRMPALTQFFAIGNSLDIIEQDPCESWFFSLDKQHKLGYPDLKIICELLGDSIHHLHLDTAVCDGITSWHLKMILQLCPELRSIVFPCYFNQANHYPNWKISHANIESVTICYICPIPHTIDEDDNEEGLLDPCTCIIRELSIQENVPKLQAVRLSGIYVDDVPERFTPEVNLKKCRMAHPRVLQWADLLDTRGVRLENQTQRRFHPSIGLPSDASLQDYVQTLDESRVEDEDDTSDASYVDSASDVTTSFVDSDIGSDDALEHEHDGEMCTTCDQRIESYTHTYTSLWLEAKPVKETNKKTSKGGSKAAKLVPLSRVSKDGGQIGWDDALERFSESLRRDEEWEEEEEEDEMYEADNEENIDCDE